jgi:5'-nucleotidase
MPAHHRILSSLLALAALGLGGQAQAQTEPTPEPPPEPPPFRVMLTSDDGINGAGLAHLRETFCAAGYQVTISAPSADRSGTSGALSLNQNIRATRTVFPCGAGEGVRWAVSGTPADAVLFGLSAAGAERPQLVISGINYGQNVGRAVNHSGTVGAAVTAAEEGVPAIAVSLAINPADAGTGFSQTLAAAPHTAAYVKALVEQLRATQGSASALLPDRVMLNLNYPVVLDANGQFDLANVQGPLITFVGRGEVVHPQYSPHPTTPDIYFAAGSICGLQVTCAAETNWNADTTALEAGKISITPIAVDWSLRPLLRPYIYARLNP